MEQRLNLRIVGPGVPEGRIGLRDLQRIVHPLEQAVRASLPTSLHSGSKDGRLRKPQARFLFTGIQAGSAVVSLELEIELVPSMAMFVVDPIRQLVEAIEGNGTALPEVAQGHLERLTRSLPDGVESVELSYGLNSAPVILRRRQAAEKVQERRPNYQLSGRLIEVNFGSRTARIQLQDPSRKRKRSLTTLLKFPEELAGDMQRCARQLVTVRGEATVSPNGIVEYVDMESIVINIDDRRGVWSSKQFKWPTLEERLDNVDMAEFLRTSREDDEDAE